jgi:hypothetical protein
MHNRRPAVRAQKETAGGKSPTGSFSKTTSFRNPSDYAV